MTVKEYYIEIEKIKNEFKTDIKEVRNELREFRKDIFGNGKPGMCTIRQEKLKDWVIVELKKIKKTPSNITEWILKIGNIAVILFLIMERIK